MGGKVVSEGVKKCIIIVWLGCCSRKGGKHGVGKGENGERGV